MTIALTDFIPDVAGEAVSTEFPGLCVPTLTNGTFSRVIPARCASCPRAVSEHKVWTHIAIGLAAQSRLWQQELIDQRNTLIERWEKLAAFCGFMHLMTNGQFQSNILGIGFLPPSSYAGGWPITAATSNTITLQYVAESTDPRDFTYGNTVQNPAWEGPGDTSHPKWISVTSHGALPQRGLLTVNGSILGFHGGWIVQRWSVDPNLAVNGTFVAYLDTPCSGNVLVEDPLHPGGPITANYHFYALAREDWGIPRPTLPFWGIHNTQTISLSDGVDNYTVEDVRRIQIDPAWISAMMGGTDVSSCLRVNHDAGGVLYETVLDLSTVNHVGIPSVTLAYWYEDDTAENSINTGQDRCLNSKRDYSNSWGTSDGTNKWYCAAGETLRALGSQGTAFLALFRPACYQTGCPGWTREQTPGDDHLGQTFMRKLFYGHPWKLTQIMAGVAQYMLDRWEVPGLASLAEMNQLTPEGYHPTIDYGFQAGGWIQVREWIENGQNLLHEMKGFEWLNQSNSGAAPNLADPATWPDQGPAGSNWTNKLGDYNQTALDGTSDPHQVQRACLGSSGPDIDCYNWNPIGGPGISQRAIEYWCWFPKLTADASQTCDDGIVTLGHWDANFELCAEGIQIYSMRIVPTLSKRWDRLAAFNQQKYGGLHSLHTIHSATLAAGVLTIAFVNKTLTASSIHPNNGEEFASSWNQGGTNVAAPEWARVHNYESSQNHWGPGRQSYIYPGCAVKFTDSAFSGHPIYNRKFAISRAKAFGSAITELYAPAAAPGWQKRILGGYLFVEYGVADQIVMSVTITRNSGAVTLGGYGDAGRLYDLAKDTYYYREGVNDAGDKGLYLFLSPLNATGTDADRVLAVSVSTKLPGSDTVFWTYTVAAYNIESDATYGFTDHMYCTYTAPAGQTIASLTDVRVRHQDGTSDSLGAYGSQPATWAEWDALHYFVAAQSGAAITILFPPHFAGDVGTVEVALSAYTGTDGDYYSAKVSSPHGASLPAGHANFANHCDEADAIDEGGCIAEIVAVHGESVFEGKTVEVYTDPLGLPGSLTLYDGDPAGTDATISSSNYAALLANQEVFVKPNMIATGHCPILKFKVYDRSLSVKALELNAPVRCAEKIIGGDGG